MRAPEYEPGLHTFAFVSGKGGVGKTVLASNFAWLCSRIAKTAIVDLDFQNQGATGLFAPHVRLSERGALHGLTSPDGDISQCLTEISESLFFIPAVSWVHSPSREGIEEVTKAGNLVHLLALFLTQLRQKENFEIVIFDCHGGVDPISFSAFELCQVTFMVTEADSVTFAGTLELLQYYEEKLALLSREQGVGGDGGEMKYIINRLPSKYKWEALEEIFSKYFTNRLGRFTSDKSIFCYIPSDSMLAESFGEYPFHIILAPKSIFASKIHFMVYRLLVGSYDLASVSKEFRQLQKQRYFKKIKTRLISNEAKNRNHIVNFLVVFSGLFILALLVVFPWTFLGGVEPEDASLYFAPFSAVFLWFFVRASFSLMFYFRDRHTFQKNLFRSVSDNVSLWQRFALLKSFGIWVAASFIPALTVIYALLFLVGLIVLFVETGV